MPKVPNLPKSVTQNAASRMAFAVAFCALTAAAVGAVVNHWMTGWMAVGGMVGVGLFYVAIGLFNMGRPEPSDDRKSSTSSSQRHASAQNLYGEPVARPHLNIVPRSDPDQNAPEEH